MIRYEGKVVWFNPAKGYGFLEAEGRADIFCYYSAIEGDGYKTLDAGDHVSFEVEPGPTGREQAARVRRSQEPSS